VRQCHRHSTDASAPDSAETECVGRMNEQRYTLADLEEAERRLAGGDSDRHSNPGSTRRWYREAQERVEAIREALIRQGDLPPPTKSPEQIERERVERGLLAIRPNPNHNDVLEFEGKRYQCKYRKVEDI
jgi:hypothetical protein